MKTTKPTLQPVDAIKPSGFQREFTCETCQEPIPGPPSSTGLHGGRAGTTAPRAHTSRLWIVPPSACSSPARVLRLSGSTDRSPGTRTATFWASPGLRPTPTDPKGPPDMTTTIRRTAHPGILTVDTTSARGVAAATDQIGYCFVAVADPTLAARLEGKASQPPAGLPGMGRFHTAAGAVGADYSGMTLAPEIAQRGFTVADLLEPLPPVLLIGTLEQTATVIRVAEEAVAAMPGRRPA